MRRALRRAVGVFLATGVLGLARPALAQTSPYQQRGRPAQTRRVLYEENVTLSEGHSRLEELKVDVALLSDVAAFPYYLGAHAVGENLEVRGYVPNERIKQRALELARRHTFLTVTDGMKIQTNLGLRPPLRGVDVLQKEGVELLAKNLGEAGRMFHLEAQANGLVTVSGAVDSVEEKLAVSRLFRQLPGCSGVVNHLTVQPIIQDGQRMAKVTKDGSHMVPATALAMEAEVVVAPPVAPRLAPVAPMPIPTWKTTPLPRKEINVPPTPLPRMEPIVPTPLPSKEPTMLPNPKPTLPPPTILPSRDLDAKDEELRLPPAPSVKPIGSRPVKVGKSDAFASQPVSSGAAKVESSDALTAPKLPSKWGATPVNRESTPPAKPVVNPIVVNPVVSKPAVLNPVVSKPVVAPVSQPAHRWPPAYDVAPPETDKGRPGTITFEDEPALKPTAHSVPSGVVRPVVPADLKRQIKAICGRQAREVEVEVQRDRSILVTVKATSAAVEKQLTAKILTVPDMASPNVHLSMKVGQ